MSDDEPDVTDETDEEAPQPELCYLCGAVVDDSTEWCAIVPDSSSIHAVDPKLDGKRMVVGCTKEHLAELVEQYKQRPFVDAELWAGKIARVMQQHPEGVSDKEMSRETGLKPAQIELGVLWQNLEFLRWRQEFGDDDPESSS
ncbi:hypothetical protein AB0D11_43105 [Streptomyces monashensis]|uniref:hypothetical protein n=1 Tax=Streptomyces monashensis TaxID=1678012 RepID=UPI0033E27565